MQVSLPFCIVALVLLGSGAAAVTSRNLVHSVLWLGITLACTAVAFVLLDAPFLAAIQVILYTGGILTLMLFGVMLTHRDGDFVAVGNPSSRKLGAGLIAGLVLAMFAVATLRTELPSQVQAAPGTAELGEAFLTEFALAFELLSVLLLAATVGAIVLSRRRDAGSDSELAGPRIAPRQALPTPSPEGNP